MLALICYTCKSLKRFTTQAIDAKGTPGYFIYQLKHLNKLPLISNRNSDNGCFIIRINTVKYDLTNFDID